MNQLRMFSMALTVLFALVLAGPAAFAEVTSPGDVLEEASDTATLATDTASTTATVAVEDEEDEEEIPDAATVASDTETASSSVTVGSTTIDISDPIVRILIGMFLQVSSRFMPPNPWRFMPPWFHFWGGPGPFGWRGPFGGWRAPFFGWGRPFGGWGRPWGPGPFGWGRPFPVGSDTAAVASDTATVASETADVASDTE
ncbi:MAG: hypothetical protein GX442_13170 [Candidatus Riflebacteria bacterium]|nr:hypothetical protein [Candidatus Riflebacteria bacterium]